MNPVQNTQINEKEHFLQRQLLQEVLASGEKGHFCVGQKGPLLVAEKGPF